MHVFLTQYEQIKQSTNAPPSDLRDTGQRYNFRTKKNRIALPDRQATILRNTQQLSRHDDFEFLDLEKTMKT